MMSSSTAIWIIPVMRPLIWSGSLQRISRGLSLALIGLGSAAAAAPYVAFPSQDSLREVQLAALACARENTASSCDRARSLADPLMDHPRLPASCKDLVWELLQQAKPAASNSFERRAKLDDPAQRLLLVCRSEEQPAKPTTPEKPGSSGGGGFGFGSGGRN